MLLTMMLAVAAWPSHAPQEGGSKDDESKDGRLKAPVAYVTDIATSESASSAASSSLQASLVRGLRTLDWELVRSACSPDMRGHLAAPEEGTAIADHRFRVREFGRAGSPALDRQAWVQRLQAHVHAWTHIELAAWKHYEFLLHPDGQAAFAAAHLTLAGPLAEGGRAELHFDLEAQLVRAGEDWFIKRVAQRGGQGVESETPPFRDLTDVMGFHFNESAEHRELQQAFIDDRGLLTIGGVNVLDWNHDGFWDVLATRREQIAVLFLNDGRGGFTRGELPLELPHMASYCILFVDLDGDGQEELLVAQPQDHGAQKSGLILFTRVEGEWEVLPNALTFSTAPGVRDLSVQTLEVGDINGDGLLDIFAGVHSDSRSGGPDFNTYLALDGGDNLLFMNLGNLRFKEESDALGITGRQYTFVARMFDFDSDGDLDLFEGNDFGPNWLWMNDGTGNFQRAEDHPLSGKSSYTMGLSLADWDNNGRLSLELSNMYSHAGHRIVPLAAELSQSMRDKVAIIGRGNEIYSQDADGTWREHGVELGINESGWAWASMFFDMDNDGDQELFVTNGNTSNADASAPDW